MKNIIYIFTILFLGTLYSCKQRNTKTDQDAKAKGLCNYDKYFKDPKTSKLAKAIFENKDWSLNDDNVLSFLDSLTANDIESRPFYFRIVTNSYKKADGYYSEGLGNAGKEYVENNTKEFLSYFDNKNCFEINDLQIWVGIVMLEFSLLAENMNDQNLMDNYIKALYKNCTGCSSNEKDILTKFSHDLQMEWEKYFNKMD